MGIVITPAPSPNHFEGRHNYQPKLVVMHTTQGNYEGAVSWLCNPKSEASAHYVISKSGNISQLVNLTDSAWCNGTSINPLSKVYYKKASNPIVKSTPANANYFTISIEFESLPDEYGYITKAQISKAGILLKHIQSELKRLYNIDFPLSKETVISHASVNPVTKPFCPGKEFPFDAIILATQPTLTFRLGDTVTIKPTAQQYATGQFIPTWVKEHKYVIMQINNIEKTALINPINSWVRLTDLVKEPVM